MRDAAGPDLAPLARAVVCCSHAPRGDGGVDAAYAVLILLVLLILAVALDSARESVAEEDERRPRGDERGRMERLGRTLEAWWVALAVIVVGGAVEVALLFVPIPFP
jgi:hypothetical protein